MSKIWSKFTTDQWLHVAHCTLRYICFIEITPQLASQSQWPAFKAVCHRNLLLILKYRSEKVYTQHWGMSHSIFWYNRRKRRVHQLSKDSFIYEYAFGYGDNDKSYFMTFWAIHTSIILGSISLLDSLIFLSITHCIIVWN